MFPHSTAFNVKDDESIHSSELSSVDVPVRPCFSCPDLSPGGDTGTIGYHLQGTGSSQASVTSGSSNSNGDFDTSMDDTAIVSLSNSISTDGGGSSTATTTTTANNNPIVIDQFYLVDKLNSIDKKKQEDRFTSASVIGSNPSSTGFQFSVFDSAKIKKKTKTGEK